MFDIVNAPRYKTYRLEQLPMGAFFVVKKKVDAGDLIQVHQKIHIPCSPTKEEWGFVNADGQMFLIDKKKAKQEVYRVKETEKALAEIVRVGEVEYDLYDDE